MTDTHHNPVFAFLRVLCDLEAKTMLTEKARLKVT